MKKVIRIKGTKINLRKGTLKMPTKAVAKLKKCVKKYKNTGTLILNDGITYAKFGKKEMCYRDVYISNDYLIVPLSTDIFNLTDREVTNVRKDSLSAHEIVDEIEEEFVKDTTKKYGKELADELICKMTGRDEVEEEPRKRRLKDIAEKCSEYFNTNMKDNKEETDNSSTITIKTMKFELGDYVLNSELPENTYFLYKDELFFKVKYGKQICSRRLPDLKSLTNVLSDSEKRELKTLRVREVKLINE